MPEPRYPRVWMLYSPTRPLPSGTRVSESLWGEGASLTSPCLWAAGPRTQVFLTKLSSSSFSIW